MTLYLNVDVDVRTDVDVSLDDIKDQIPDKHLRQLYEERFHKLPDRSVQELSDWAENTSHLADREGPEWINRWLAEYNLKLERTSK